MLLEGLLTCFKLRGRNKEATEKLLAAHDLAKKHNLTYLEEQVWDSITRLGIGLQNSDEDDGRKAN